VIVLAVTVKVCWIVIVSGGSEIVTIAGLESALACAAATARLACRTAFEAFARATDA
jgi:hypothetical protein